MSASFFFKKLWDLLATLLLMSLLVFMVFYWLPGDPVAMILGTEAPQEKRAALEEALNLDESAPLRYFHSVTGLFSEEHPSMSIRFQKPVRELMAPRLSLTLTLAFYAFVLILLLSLPLAIFSARNEGGPFDRVTGVLCQFFMAVPGFFLGILIILLFAFVFRKQHVLGSVDLEAGFSERLKGLFLPALAIALPRLSQAVQFLRTALLQGREQDYVRTARAKGAGASRLLWHHLMRNSLIPFMTTLSLILADLITGSLIVEQVFVLPGTGRLLITAIEARDLPLAQGIIMAISCLVVLINLVTDLLSLWVDPRVGREAEHV